MGGGVMSEALKPCPFCGGEPEMYGWDDDDDDGGGAVILCGGYRKPDGCGARIERSKEMDFDEFDEEEEGRLVDEAVSAWNRRAPLRDEEGLRRAIFGVLYGKPWTQDECYDAADAILAAVKERV
jgi:hypothetical protein